MKKANIYIAHDNSPRGWTNRYSLFLPISLPNSFFLDLERKKSRELSRTEFDEQQFLTGESTPAPIRTRFHAFTKWKIDEKWGGEEGKGASIWKLRQNCRWSAYGPIWEQRINKRGPERRCARSATGRVSLPCWFPCTLLTLLTDAQPRRIGINETTFTSATLASFNQHPNTGVEVIKNVARIINAVLWKSKKRGR